MCLRPMGVDGNFDYVINFMIGYAQYNHVGGCTYFLFPESLLGKGVLNITIEKDSYCFAYSILASIHPWEIRITHTLLQNINLHART